MRHCHPLPGPLPSRERGIQSQDHALTDFQLVFLALAFVGLSWSVFKIPGLKSFDLAIYQIAQGWAGPLWLRLNGMVSFFGEGTVLIAVSFAGFIYCWVRSRVRLGLWYFLAVVIALQVNSVLKVFFLRPRPEFFDPTMLLPSTSYPSGHALGITVFSLLSWQVMKQFAKPKQSWVILPWVAIVAVGLSRIFLGVHWASDVAGGILLGLIWVLVVQKLKLLGV